MANDNGLNTALYHLSSACCSLESSRPGLAEVKAAKKAAKTAHELLDAAETFMANGVYVVCDEPRGAYVDPAQHKIEMPEITNIELDEPAPAPELPQLPEELLAFDTWDDEDAQTTYHSRTDDLADKVFPDPSIEPDFAPWEAAWEAGPKDAFTRLLVAEARETPSFDLPTDEERDAWLAKHAPQAPEAEITTEIPDDEDAMALTQEMKTAGEFDRKLDELEEAGVEQGLKRKAWKKAEKAWREAFDLNPDEALDAILMVLTSPKVTWEVPAREWVTCQMTGTEGGEA